MFVHGIAFESGGTRVVGLINWLRVTTFTFLFGDVSGWALEKIGFKLSHEGKITKWGPPLTRAEFLSG